MDKASMSNLSTAVLSSAGLLISQANAWANEYLPLVTVLGIIFSAIITVIFHLQRNKQARLTRTVHYDLIAQRKEILRHQSAEMSELKSKLKKAAPDEDK